MMTFTMTNLPFMLLIRRAVSFEIRLRQDS
jgi:hypothetical protein